MDEGVLLVVGAPSHTHGLSFTRKLQPMSKNSPRTYQTEAVVAASGAAGGRREATRCSNADDREDGCGRPCALQRQVPAVLRVRSETTSDSVRLQRVGLYSCDAETGTRSANLHGQVQFSKVVDMPVVVQRLAPGSGQSRQLWSSTVPLF